MPDISKCKGNHCALRNFCYRFTSEDEGEFQSYLVNPPFTLEEKLIQCPQFWYNKVTIIESEHLKKRLLEQLKESHQLGYQAGGSGHLGHISMELTTTVELKEVPRATVFYVYSRFVESEFSCTEYIHANVGHIDANFTLTKTREMSTEMISHSDDLGFGAPTP